MKPLKKPSYRDYDASGNVDAYHDELTGLKFFVCGLATVAALASSVITGPLGGALAVSSALHCGFITAVSYGWFG